MGYNKIKTKWGTKHVWTKHSSIPNFPIGTIKKDYYITRPSVLKTVFDLGLSITGGAIMYSVGWGLGELVEYLPIATEFLSKGIEFISGLEVNENVSGVGGLTGAVYGILDSGIKLDRNANLERIRITPFHYYKF